MTYLHCRCLVEVTKDLDPDVASHVEARVLPGAGVQTVGEFRRAVTRAVLALDPADSADRQHPCRRERRVECYPCADGMATVWTLLPAADAETVMTCLDALAGRVNDPGDDRTMDQRRADALIDLAVDALDRVPTAGVAARPSRSASRYRHCWDSMSNLVTWPGTGRSRPRWPANSPPTPPAPGAA